MLFHKRKTRWYFFKNFSTFIGLVLIWRGVWYVFDGIDKMFFNGGHVWSAIGGVVIGLLMLYLPDRDLKEIERL